MKRNLKILSYDQLVAVREQARREGATIVATSGCFDLLHLGHMRLLAEAAKRGDYLVVLLNSDRSVRALKGEGRPINNAYVRAQMLAHLSSVDGVYVFDGDTPAEILKDLQPDVYVKGSEYEDDHMPEIEVLKGKIMFVDSLPGISTTGTIKKIRGEG